MSMDRRKRIRKIKDHLPVLKRKTFNELLNDRTAKENQIESPIWNCGVRTNILKAQKRTNAQTQTRGGQM